MKEIFQKKMEQLYPVKSLEEEKNSIVEELQEKGFVITKFSDGGIFNMLLVIFLQIKRELMLFARRLQLDNFISSAEGVALDLKATDFGKIRNEATKAKGKIVLTRSDTSQKLVIEKGTIFKTNQDQKGEELRYFSLKNTELKQGESQVQVEIEAEMPGSKYNVSAGSIRNCIFHIESVDTISNEEHWIDYPGTEEESEEDFRTRLQNSWEELAMIPTSGKYKLVAEQVPGILYAFVNDLHPRGQGTIDIHLASVLGQATTAQIEAAKNLLKTIKSPHDDIEVKSVETKVQNISVEISIEKGLSKVGIEEKAKEEIKRIMRISKQKNLHELYIADIIFALKSSLLNIKNVRVLEPTADVFTTDKILLLGTVNVQLKEV